MRQFLFTFVVFTIFMLGFLLALRFSKYKHEHAKETDESCGTCGDGECLTCASTSKLDL